MEGAEKVILGTTDSTGKLENISLNCDDITLYSSVAKNLENLSEDYRKTIAIDEDSENVYVMPDGDVYYWYGYDSGDLEIINEANGWTTHASYAFITPTFDTNSIKMTIGTNKTTGYGTISPKTYSNSTAHYIGSTTSNSTVICSSVQKTNYTPRTDIITQSTPNTVQHLSTALDISNQHLVMISHFIAGTMTHEFYAFWVGNKNK